MRCLGVAAAVALACFAATAAPAAQDSQRVDVSGMWSFANQTDHWKTAATWR